MRKYRLAVGFFLLGCLCTALFFGINLRAQAWLSDRAIDDSVPQTWLYAVDPAALARGEHVNSKAYVPKGSFPYFTFEGLVKPISLRDDPYAVYYHVVGGKIEGPYPVEGCVASGGSNGCSETRPGHLPPR